MDNKELRTLKILEEIDKNQSINQRALAGNLNISLGLANSFIKRLAKKGYIKVSSIPKNRMIYLLTPTGAAEKTRLTYNYIKYSFKFYKETRSKMVSLFDKISKEGIKKVAFYGATEVAEIAYISLKDTSIEFEGIYDLKKVGTFMGKQICNTQDIRYSSFDRLIITDDEISKKEILNLDSDKCLHLNQISI
ncbi:MAG: winged helix-turn-helix transcriptional regulator [Desulfobacterales bacterium]|nr:winged helix-turn-helix transcriptional regulator [Desulfobacterales bacterium]